MSFIAQCFTSLVKEDHFITLVRPLLLQPVPFCSCSYCGDDSGDCQPGEGERFLVAPHVRAVAAPGEVLPWLGSPPFSVSMAWYPALVLRFLIEARLGA